MGPTRVKFTVMPTNVLEVTSPPENQIEFVDQGVNAGSNPSATGRLLLLMSTLSSWAEAARKAKTAVTVIRQYDIGIIAGRIRQPKAKDDRELSGAVCDWHMAETT